VLLEDVERHAARSSGDAADAQPDGVVPLHGLRRVTAGAVATAWRTIPAMVEFRDVDASALVRARSGTAFTYLPFFVRAVAATLERHANFNASFDAERIAVLQHVGVHIGIAVATENGLIVPVLRDAQRRTLAEIAAELERLVGEARARRIAASDLAGAAVTITNYGSYGTTAGIPIVRAGESAIVGFGAIRDAVVALGGVPAVRPTMTLTVAADHRLNDGRDLAAFTSTIAMACAEADAVLG
jgi:pyruvate dehydrogenase E2 component (dihydrolipoamide acetyltransferase)